MTNTVTIPANAPPSYYLILKTDDQNAVFEANETNNWLTFRVGVPPEPLPEALQVSMLASGQLRMTITGNPGRALNLQGTPDLFHWAVLGRYTNQSGTLVITNAPPPGRAAYFYRTVAIALTSPPPVPAPSLSGALRLPDGRMRFQLNSTAGTAWQLQGSPDLWHWGNYGLLTNQTGTMPVTNAPFGRPASYFYRAVQP